MAAWLALIDPISRLIDKIIPDKQAAAQAKLDMMKEENAFALAEIQAAVTLDTGQMNINVEEAKSDNLFVAGWRPAIGWSCALAFAYKFIIQPFMVFVLVASGSSINPAILPVLDWAEMTPVLMGMLGLGYLRTKEKLAR